MEAEAEAIADRYEGRGGSKQPRSGGRRGGHGGAGGRAQRGGTEVSRALSRLLRHQAEKAGIKLDREGYAPLDKVLQWGPLRTMGVTLADVREVVASNDKQRFSMRRATADEGEEEEDDNDPAHWLIRANQGHSIRLESEALLRPVTLEEPGSVPPVVVHGTYFAAWPAILAAGGLRPMGRTHVHCATGLPEAAAAAAGTAAAEQDEKVISGMRRDAELLIYIDVARSLSDGALRWWTSDNGVVLTEGDDDGLVPLRYFREVVGRRPDANGLVVGTLWRDGEKVADLPEGVRGRGWAPGGRGGGGGGGGRGRGRGRGRGGGGGGGRGRGGD